MSNRVLLVHKGKHHVFHSLLGITQATPQTVGFFGIYNNSQVIKKVLKLLGQEKKLAGYRMEEIDSYIKTNMLCKILFLLSKKSLRAKRLFDYYFEKASEKYLSNVDYIHVVQDYTNQLIRKAKKSDKQIIYEQIIAPSYTQRDYLKAELEKWSYPMEHLEKLVPSKRVEEEIENLSIADYIHVPSQFVKDCILHKIGVKNENKVVMWPYGVNINKFPHSLKSFNGSRKLKILCVSRVSLLKGTKYLIEAMKLLQNENVHLTYVGLCLEDEYIPLKRELQDLKNVTYLHSIPHSEMGKIYMDSDLFLLPSLIEGSSLVIYEALSCGLPCIVTPNTGSIVIDQHNGYVIKEKAIEDIVDKVKLFFEFPHLLENLSHNSRETVSEYTWARFSENMGTFYRQIVFNQNVSAK